MNSDQENEVNQVAYRQLKSTIDATYPAGRFVAIHRGRIVADAATFEEIEKMLDAMGPDTRNALVAQAGTPDMENWLIFPLEYQ